MKKAKTIAPAIESSNEVVTPVAETVAPVVETTTEVKAKPGRPVVEGSARQLRLQARAEKLANGGLVKRGRPVVAGSARQARLDARAAKIAAGLAIKPGRPKMVKVEEPKAEVATA